MRFLYQNRKHRRQPLITDQALTHILFNQVEKDLRGLHSSRRI
jgi:hypothetical protein